MKLNSSEKITVGYNIDEVLNDTRVKATVIDLSSEVETDVKDEEGKVVGKEYTYDAYQLELMNDVEYISSNIPALLIAGKDEEYNRLADEVRAKRKKLLEDTDNYAMSDRVMSDAMKTYRQALRDIPEQEGFPYEVVYPVKPEE